MFPAFDDMSENSMTIDLAPWARPQFAALELKVNGHSAAYFDGPGGTQVPECVIDAIGHYLRTANANHAGFFETSLRSDRILAEAHQAVADFLGSSDPGTVAFGQNMTSLTFAFSRALARTWQPGDEIIVTRLDHDANVQPWVLAARDAGATVRFIGIDPADCTLNLSEFEQLINERTRLVAVGCASNATGGVNPVRKIADLAHRQGALVYLDAVHYAPHASIDVADFDCDFLACSAYKFFGPHIGILWGRRRLLEELEAYKVRPATDEIPGKWMTGTQSHEAIAATTAAIDYLAALGRHAADKPALGRREALLYAFQAIQEYESSLARQFITGLSELPSYRIVGISDLSRMEERMPTFSILHREIVADELARRLANQGMFAWSGNYYALQLTETLGLEPDGMLRIGLVHYNTTEEVERLLQTLAEWN